MLDFFKVVLPPTGPYCVAFKNKERKGFIHRAALDYLGAVKQTVWGASKGWDAYFCISSLKANEWIDDGGKAHVRKKQNCARTKVLVLDVDISLDDNRKYGSKEDGLSAIRALQDSLGFPNPVVVDSGYGLHIYWLLSKSVKSESWEVLARYFKAAVVSLDPKLAADTSRISDCAGVLRVPGTKNYKVQGEPKDVKLLQYTEETISPQDATKILVAKLKERGVESPKTPAKENKNAIDLSVDVPHRVEPIIAKCNWIREYIRDMRIASEPEWYAVLGLVKHCYHPQKDTAALAHMFSRGHPGYSPESTLEKFNQVKLAQSGPTICERFRLLKADRCKGCQYAKYVKSPAQLDQVSLPSLEPIKLELEYKGVNGHAAKYIAETVPIPSPYFRGKDGGIYMHLFGGSMDNTNPDPDGIKQIYEYDILPMARLQNEDTGEEEIEIMVDFPKDGKKIIRVPNEYTIDPKQFVSYLTARGVLLKQHEVAPLMNYMIDYTRIIQRTTQARGVYTRFGWRDAQSEHPIFVFGDGVIDSSGNFTAGTTANWLNDLTKFSSAKGDVNKWREAFEVNLNYSIQPYQFAVMLGFAAPLFALTPYHGMIFNLLGSGGIGKSTSLKFMTSIWGKPTFTHVLQKDNSIPMFNKVGYLNSIPVAYDEITNLPADQTADLAYSITEGRGKERADRSGNTKVNFVRWSTILVSCSNLSLYEKIGLAKKGNAAPSYRIFETEVREPIKEENRSRIEEAIKVLDDNYGVAGRYYMQYVVKNNRAVMDRLVKAEEEISKQFELRSSERFWGGMFAAVSVSMDICHELELHHFKKDELLQWAYDELTVTRKSLQESQGNAVNILSHFINSNLHATLFVSDNHVNAYGLSTTPTRELHIRLEKSQKRFTHGYISCLAFKNYCVQNKVEYSWVTKELKEFGAIKPMIASKRLGAGTEFSGAPMSCLELDFECSLIQEGFVNERNDGIRQLN